MIHESYGRNSGRCCSENATGEAGREEGRPHETQSRQGEVSAGGAHVRHVQHTAAVNGRNNVGHIDTPLRPCTE